MKSCVPHCVRIETAGRGGGGTPGRLLLQPLDLPSRPASWFGLVSGSQVAHASSAVPVPGPPLSSPAGGQTNGGAELRLPVPRGHPGWTRAAEKAHAHPQYRPKVNVCSRPAEGPARARAGAPTCSRAAPHSVPGEVGERHRQPQPGLSPTHRGLVLVWVVMRGLAALTGRRGSERPLPTVEEGRAFRPGRPALGRRPRSPTAAPTAAAVALPGTCPSAGPGRRGRGFPPSPLPAPADT